jgi:hypothetical protein
MSRNYRSCTSKTIRAIPTEATRLAGIRKKGDAYDCTFRFQEQHYCFTIGNVSETQAQSKSVEVVEAPGLVECGQRTVTEGLRLEDFVAAGGKA